MNEAAIKDGSWQDITQEFLSSVKQLSLGELLKTEQLTLLEAMSAIELMDPKMDSGMMLKKSNRKILTLEQSIKLGLVKTNNLELDELIGIIDQTYSCLTTWFDGNPLTLTVMTNLYLLDTERIEDRCLRVFSQSMLKIVDSIDKLVQMVFCVEEEDFFLNVCKFALAQNINDQKVSNSLEDLCQYYEKLIANLGSNSSQQSNNNSSHSGDQSNCKRHESPNDEIQPMESNNIQVTSRTYDKSQLIALVHRLRFTHSFYACLLNISRNIVRNHWDLNDATQTDAQLQKTVKLVQSSIQACDQNLENCLKYLDRWNESIDIGIKPEPAATEKVNQNDGDYPTIMGFEPFIHHKLLPAGYPRCLSIKSRPAAVEHLKNLILRLRKCVSISSSFNQRCFNKSLDLIENFSKYFRPGSCVISRSFIQTLYLPNRSVKLLKDELLQSMTDYCEPLFQAMRKDASQSIALDGFLSESYKPFSQLIGLYGHNAARQHERFTELIISFKNLQYTSLLIDGACKPTIVYSWTTYNLARLCIKYVLSGLELELFSSHEYPYVFWYLYDVLYRNEREQLEMAKQFIFERQLTADIDLKGTKGKRQRRRNQFSTIYHDERLSCNDAYRFLTGGTFLLTYGLKVQGKIKSPVMDFTNEEICFEHRFGTLTGYSVYQNYRQSLVRLRNIEHVYREALDCFNQAKGLFESLGQHEDCLKVCKANMVVARILSSNLDSFTDREIEFSFESHPSFPTVKI